MAKGNAMQIEIAPGSHEIERPWYVWPAVFLEVLTGLLAIPVGWSFIQDPTGRALGIPQGWNSDKQPIAYPAHR